ncbi:MAG: hypothetical protein ACK5QT_08515 [Oligoflexia bacterium]
MRDFIRRFCLLVSGASLVGGPLANAGVFTTIHFLEPGQNMVGFEPEFVLTGGAGLAGNLRFQRGLTELSNVSLILGTGSGPRQFRAGANGTLDLFPDIEGQPGVGIAGQGVFYQTPNAGLFEVTAIPYIHEEFDSAQGGVEPYFAFPFGAGFTGGRYQSVSSAVVGTFFKANERVRYSIELAVGVSNAESALSGGFAYRFNP